MLRGRPRKPEAVKAGEGHRSHVTRAELFARLETGADATHGRPDLPLAFEISEADEPHTQALKQRAQHYWSIMLEDLEREGRLCVMDGPIISAAAQTQALMDKAFDEGDSRRFTELSQAYRQFADRLGLNPASRSKLPTQTKPTVSALDSALCA